MFLTVESPFDAYLAAVGLEIPRFRLLHSDARIIVFSDEDFILWEA